MVVKELGRAIHRWQVKHPNGRFTAAGGLKAADRSGATVG